MQNFYVCIQFSYSFLSPNPDRAPTRTGPQPGLGPNPLFGVINLISKCMCFKSFCVLLVLVRFCFISSFIFLKMYRTILPFSFTSIVPLLFVYTLSEKERITNTLLVLIEVDCVFTVGGEISCTV